MFVQQWRKGEMGRFVLDDVREEVLRGEVGWGGCGDRRECESGEAAGEDGEDRENQDARRAGQERDGVNGTAQT